MTPTLIARVWCANKRVVPNILPLRRVARRVFAFRSQLLARLMPPVARQKTLGWITNAFIAMSPNSLNV